jgi:hypothetical protein
MFSCLGDTVLKRTQLTEPEVWVVAVEAFRIEAAKRILAPK